MGERYGHFEEDILRRVVAVISAPEAARAIPVLYALLAGLYFNNLLTLLVGAEGFEPFRPLPERPSKSTNWTEFLWGDT